MNTYVAILLTLFIAMVLSVPQGVQWLSVIMPPWTLLMLIFWCVYGRKNLGVLSAAALGLLQDSVTGAVLGTHILSYTMVVAFVLSQKQRLKIYSFGQQAAFVFIALVLVQLLHYILLALQPSYETNHFFVHLLPAITGALLWPMIAYCTLQLFRYFSVFNETFG